MAILEGPQNDLKCVLDLHWCLWDSYSEDKVPKARFLRLVRVAIFVVIGIVVFVTASNQAVNLMMNVQEFGIAFTKPLYYSLISGLGLGSVALVRVNIFARRSIVWYALLTFTQTIRKTGSDSPKELRYSSYQLPATRFAIWQLTKVILAGSFFANITFGMACDAVFHGLDLGFTHVVKILSLPFSDVSSDPTISKSTILPALLPMTIVIPPLLSVIGIRILLYVGFDRGVDIATRYVKDLSQGKPRFLSYISSIELVAGTFLIWISVNMLLSSNVDYNSRYFISTALAIGLSFIAFGLLDKKRSKVIIYPNKRHLYSRFVTIASLVSVLAAILAVNGSIADTKSIELQGSYITQQIAVNRQLADIDNISTVQYQPDNLVSKLDLGLETAAPSNVTLENIQVWDQDAAQSKLRSALGQRNDITLSDTSLLRFGERLYWTGATAPTLPIDVRPSDKWFSEHFVFTKSNAGINMVQVNTGNISEGASIFPQKEMYYGESGDSGLFNKVWSAYPTQARTSFETDGYIYTGAGGIDLSPPLSWIFEPNFLFSYPDKTIHIMRYKDIFDRMNLLYPYFAYDFQFGDTVSSQFRKIHATPVSDGQRAQWLIPLTVALDTSRLPWAPSFVLKLVGFGLVDSYDGSVKIYVTGTDPFSKMFYELYRNSGQVSTNVPDWLAKQIKYPEELYVWRVSKFNIYHVSDATEFMQARQFYEIAKDGGVVIPPSSFVMIRDESNSPHLVSVQPVQLHDSSSKDLVGYMLLDNNLDNLGNLTFYAFPANSTSSLIGPSLAREILSKDKDFQSIKTLGQSTPRIGHEALYQLGSANVYFIPVYTSTSPSGSVPQLVTVAAVGAVSLQGKYYVGLGDNPALAFARYLEKVTAQNSSNTTSQSNSTMLTREQRITSVEDLFEAANVTLVKATSVQVPAQFQENVVRYGSESDMGNVKSTVSSFIEHFARQNRVYEWHNNSTSVNFGVIKDIQGVPESHYITFEVQ